MKVSVILPIIPTKEYAEYARQARESIRKQGIPVEMVSFLTLANQNVAEATNEGARDSSGEYIMRLDCDDFLHPMACEIMSNYLDSHPYVAAVFSDYWETDETGEPQKVVAQSSIPHPGCMMIRKQAFEDIGGFNPNLHRQEGTDFFYRLSKNHKVEHLSIPLWYYRRHEWQMSRAHNEVIRARHEIKTLHEKHAEKILAIIPARGGSKGIPRKNLVELNNVPLVSHAIRTAKQSEHDIMIVVSTEDGEIAEVAEASGANVIRRDPEDARDEVDLITVAKHTMEQVDATGYHADIVATIQPTAPLTPVYALDNAISRLINNHTLDSVVSMSEVIGKHPYRMYKSLSSKRFAPLFPEQSEKFLQRQDRPAAYQFTGGFYVRRRKLLEEWTGEDFALGNWEGELVSQKEGIDIDTRFDLWLVEAVLSHQED